MAMERVLETFETNDYLDASPFEASYYLDILGVVPYPGIRILDIGCGNGAMVKYLQAKRLEAYGVESRDTKIADGEIFFREDARRTHFPNGYFGAVTERLVFAQLIGLNNRPDVAYGILREIQRVVMKGGILISRSPEVLTQIPIDEFGVTPVRIPIPRAGSMYSVLRFV